MTMDNKKNFLLGAFILAAIGLVVWSLMFLNPTVGDAKRTLRVRFPNIDKVTVGTRVTYAGKPIGEVIEVIPVSDARAQEETWPTIYPYELVLAIDSSVKIYSSDEIGIRTSGLLGERSINITPRPLVGRELELVPDGDLLYSAPAASVEDTVSSFSALSGKVEVMLDQLNDILESSGDDIDDAVIALKNSLERFEGSLAAADEVELWQAMKDGISALQRALTQLEDKDFYDHLSEITGNISDITRSVNQPDAWKLLIDNLSCLCRNVARISDRVEQLWPTIDQGAGDFAEAAANIRDFTTDLKQGQGNLGKFLSDDGLYLQVRGILAKVETLMDDVNHYGVLFHLDRSWQRQRTRRANRLAELCTAQQFRGYFQEELSQIDSSLTRVTSLLDRIDCDPCIESPLEDPQYSSAFLELLRRVQGVEERLQEYNASFGRDEGGLCVETRP